MDILSWICLDLRKTEDLMIRKEIRWKNSWFKFGAELQRQLPKYLICFVWNTTFVVYKVNDLPPTSSVIKGHFRRNVFSLQHKCSKKTNGTSFLECTYLKKDCVLLPDRIFATCNCGSDWTTKRRMFFEVQEPCLIFCLGKSKVLVWM